MNPVWVTYLFHCRIIPYGVLQYAVPPKEETLITLTKRQFLWFVRVSLKFCDNQMDFLVLHNCLTSLRGFSSSPRQVYPFLPI